MNESRKTGVELIAMERDRQVTGEGWTPQHDDQHAHGELAMAAAVYALPRVLRAPYPAPGIPDLWPFVDGWKPTSNDRVRELVKAGALIAAEIDRLQRSERCPICDSPSRELHPAVQHGGEVQICPATWHC